MKKLCFSLFFILIFGIIQYGLLPFSPPKEHPLRIIAHRGDSHIAPENTLPAVEAALQSGADCIELDIRSTSDGIPILFHDKNAKRMADIDQPVSEMNCRDFLSLPLHPPGSNENYRTITPCTLEDVLLLCKNHPGTVLHFELKTPGTEEKVASLLKKYDFESSYEISSADLKIIEKFKQQNADAKIYWILSSTEDICRYILFPPDSLDGISVKSLHVTASLTSLARKRNHKIYAWTVNHRFQLHRLRHLGIDGIITDNPSSFRKILS